MSGHNKWSSIKHKKGAADAKRGQVFTRLVKEIILAAKTGGGDPDMNPRLRTAINTAKENNMPKENIERAIKRGTGEIEGAAYEEVIYEGYGHNGVGIVVEVMTDNKKRSVSELRHTFSKFGGNLAETGSVAWNFEQKGFSMFLLQVWMKMNLCLEALKKQELKMLSLMMITLIFILLLLIFILLSVIWKKRAILSIMLNLSEYLKMQLALMIILQKN